MSDIVAIIFYVNFLVSGSLVIGSSKIIEIVMFILLIDSDPCFPKYEMELWRRISIVLTDLGDVDRLYDSSSRFIEYLNSLDGMIHIREEVADVVESYCAGLHNADALEKHCDFLTKCDEILQRCPENERLGEALCEGYEFLINARFFHNNSANVSLEWQKIVEYIRQFDFRVGMCRDAMKTAHDYMITLIRKNDLQDLLNLAHFLEEVYIKVHIVEVAEVAALCSANIYSISYMKHKTKSADENEKVKRYLADFPESMYVKAAYLTVCRVDYLDTSTYRRVPDGLINDAKVWAEQYPGEIEFPEGYFGLLLARLEYAQAHDQRNEQRRIFREMKSVAEQTDYLPYTKGVYKLKEPTLYAEQTRLFRRRKRACEALEEHMLDCDVCWYLWEAIQAFENYPFIEDCEKRFKYRIDCDQIVCNGIRLTRKEIEEAFKKVRKLQIKQGGVCEEDALRCCLAKELLVVFLRIGACKRL